MTRQMHLGGLALDGPGVHPLFPVGVILVDHLQRDRPAQRASVADPARHIGAITLDLHPPTASVTQLTAGQVAIYLLTLKPQACRQAFDDARQAGTVRFTGGGQLQGHTPRLRGKSALPPGG